MKNAKQIVNTLLVEVFNHILDIEEEYINKLNVNLSIKEIHVLEAINLVDEKTMSNIARKLRITVGSLTVSIDRLVSKGFVLRENDPSDRRIVRLALSNKAKIALKSHDDFHDAMLNDIFHNIDVEEQQTLVKSLEYIKDYFIKKY
ncbi:MAG: MarR family winged helix-turn-helix transcriptional regulator [Anaeroplasmataceae bacterium]